MTCGEKLKLLVGTAKELERSSLKTWGKTLVVAPHPDDESLGCGGLLAVMVSLNLPVEVAILSDGAASHPNSTSCPPAKLAQLRKLESEEAAKKLGLSKEQLHYFDLPDSKVPGYTDEEGLLFDDPRTTRTIEVLTDFLTVHSYDTVLCCWRRDPHCDHRATHYLMSTALTKCTKDIRFLEYPIWVWETKQERDLPCSNDKGFWTYLNIKDKLPLKKASILEHKTQLGQVIKDDPEGFVLQPDMIDKFLTGREYFFVNEKVPPKKTVSAFQSQVNF